MYAVAACVAFATLTLRWYDFVTIPAMRVRLASILSAALLCTAHAGGEDCNNYNYSCPTAACQHDWEGAIARLAAGGTLEVLAQCVDNTYTSQLTVEAEALSHAPNDHARPVRNGHFVAPLRLRPLSRPQLLAVSNSTFEYLGLDPREASRAAFTAIFSGNDAGVEALQPLHSNPWATPYGLSIYGGEQIADGGVGDGYGDGRAASLCTVGGWELQLKGSGPTPFARRGDGNAVIRSSTREFLASEAMFWLGVPTTRALSLVASYDDTDMATRPWYSTQTTVDPFYRPVPPHGGDIMHHEFRAITTRVAHSFVRVGSLELYARRWRRTGDPLAKQQLEELFWYVRDREGYGTGRPPLADAVRELIDAARRRFISMTLHWKRVGYVQSNFNSDNCLVGGATLDYGPFGFMERYDPGWAMWVGSGEHYSFGNQLEAARRNWETLVSSLEPLLDDAARDRPVEYNYAHYESLTAALTVARRGFADYARNATEMIWAAKLGLCSTSDLLDRYSGFCFVEKVAAASKLWADASALLDADVDYTLFWRRLAAAARTDTDALEALTPAFYVPPSPAKEKKWRDWLARWRRADPDADAMNKVNPLCVPREWMLVEAYEAAERGDNSVIETLQRLFARPYSDDHDPRLVEKYARRAPAGARHQGGVGYMS